LHPDLRAKGEAGRIGSLAREDKGGPAAITAQAGNLATRMNTTGFPDMSTGLFSFRALRQWSRRFFGAPNFARQMG